MGTHKYILTLHRYFIWADRMRSHFYYLLNKDIAKLKSKDTEEADQFRTEINIYMSYWYGGMYVLIEGWKELGLSDSKIDKLLLSPNVNLLRHYRNGVFHFQKEYFDKRFIGFINSDDSTDWVYELRNEFSRFFLHWLKQGEKSCQRERGSAGERSFASQGQNKRPCEKQSKTGPVKR